MKCHVLILEYFQVAAQAAWADCLVSPGAKVSVAAMVRALVRGKGGAMGEDCVTGLAVLTRLTVVADSSPETRTSARPR